MISASCKELSRLELFYRCVKQMVYTVSKKKPESVLESMKCYLKEGHENEVIYRSRPEEIEGRMKELTKNGEQLLKQFEKDVLCETEAYGLLKRMMEEQTQQTEGERQLLSPKEIKPESLQNPTDPDAAYRTKHGKTCIGYVGNLREECNESDSIVTQYDVKKATYSDPQFTKDLLETLGVQETERELLVDGAYYSDESAKQAKEQRIHMIPSGIVGRAPKGDYSAFEIEERDQEVIQCPQGNKPIHQKYSKGIYKAYFEKEVCEKCSLREKCPIKEQKRRYMLKVSETQYHTSKVRKEMKTSEYRKRAMKRAGIEGLPSALRRKYQIDRLPVRGLVRVKTWFGLAVEAINIFRYVKREQRHRKQQKLSVANL